MDSDFSIEADSKAQLPNTSALKYTLSKNGLKPKIMSPQAKRPIIDSDCDFSDSDQESRKKVKPNLNGILNGNTPSRQLNSYLKIPKIAFDSFKGDVKKIKQSFLNPDYGAKVNFLNLSFDERLDYFSQKRRDKSSEMEVELFAERHAECNFTPKVNNSSIRRSFNNFLEEQKEFLEAKKENTVAKNKKKLEDEIASLQQSPTISKKSILLSSKKKRSKSKIYYDLSSPQEKTKNQRKNLNKSFDIKRFQLAIGHLKNYNCNSFIQTEEKSTEKKKDSDRFVFNKISRDLDEAIKLSYGKTKEKCSLSTFCKI